MWDPDLAGVYDTLMGALRIILPSEDQEELDEGIALIESQAGIKIRAGLLVALADEVIYYAYPVGASTQSPAGGVVVVAKLKNAALTEKTLGDLEKFVTTIADEKMIGMLSIITQQRGEKTAHIWMVPAVAMAQVVRRG